MRSKMGDIVELQVTTQLAGDDRSAALVERWFVDLLHHLVAAWDDKPGEASDRAATPEKLGTLELGSAWIELYASRERKQGRFIRSIPWGPNALRDFVKEVATDGTEGTAVLHQPDGGIFPGLVNIGLSRPDSVPEWVYFTASFDEQILANEEMAGRVMRFLKGFAQLANPSFGHVGPEFSIRRTALESLLRRVPDDWLPGSRETLRGYSWLTICSQEIGDQLGGEEGLRATKAFVEVSSLKAGGYWLLATPAYLDYDMEVATRVFRAMALVLPAGMPMDPSKWRDRDQYKVVLEDPSLLRPWPHRRDAGR
jgi:hypothetical protein